MARISSKDSEKLLQITSFLGLNEGENGDTGLKAGEAAVMENFMVTADGKLKKRPGSRTILDLPALCGAEASPVRGLWRGYVGKRVKLLAACGGKLWEIRLLPEADATVIAELSDAETSFFGFSDKVYIINGHEYLVWPGYGEAEEVEGYRPLVVTAASPEGEGRTLEQVNKLNGLRRVLFAADGAAKSYKLPEEGLTSIDKVILGGSQIGSYTADLEAGTLSFGSAPAAGTNNLEVWYTKGSGDRKAVLAMRFAEMYNGFNDNRIFLYGDGSNKAFYSGLDSNGKPTAEYFPDLNVLDVGTENSPLTALVRHFGQLLCFKSDSAYVASYDTVLLEDSTVISGFFLRPIDRDRGNIPMGQVRLVNNYPVSFQGNSALRWSLLSSYGVQDERSARPISQNVRGKLADFDLEGLLSFDDDYRRQLWLVSGGRALIYDYNHEARLGGSYKNNIWYFYSQVDITSFISIDGELYTGSSEGKIVHRSHSYKSDDGLAIPCYYETGALDFGVPSLKKSSAQVWVSTKPESNSRFTITVETNKAGSSPTALVASSIATFEHVDFAHWSFLTSRRPQVSRLRLRTRKFTYYKIKLSSNSASSSATILSINAALRFGAKA